jgi:hypothetical protein
MASTSLHTETQTDPQTKGDTQIHRADTTAYTVSATARPKPIICKYGLSVAPGTAVLCLCFAREPAPRKPPGSSDNRATSVSVSCPLSDSGFGCLNRISILFSLATSLHCMIKRWRCCWPMPMKVSTCGKATCGWHSRRTVCMCASSSSMVTRLRLVLRVAAKSSSPLSPSPCSSLAVCLFWPALRRLPSRFPPRSAAPFRLPFCCLSHACGTHMCLSERNNAPAPGCSLVPHHRTVRNSDA